MKKLILGILILILSFANNKLCGQIVINEICTFNDDVLEDVDGDKSDWMELYNNTSIAQDLSEFSIYSTKQKILYQLPSVLLNSNGYHIIFLSGKNKYVNEIHASFKMLLGDSIILIKNQNNLQTIIVPDLIVDHSYGAVIDGSVNFEIFLDPTPGTTNNYNQHVISYTEKPVLSLQSGFYTGVQNISISNTTPGAITYYTLDGKEPSVSSQIYTAPISIYKTCVVKAFSIAPGLPASKKLVNTFFIDETHDITVISISTDSLLLFDSISGLLQPGPNASAEPPYYGANFWSDNQIEVRVQIFDKSHNEIINQECELQIHGGSMNRSQAMKSFRLLSKKKFEKDRFYAPLIPDKPISAFRKIVLRNGSSDFLKSQIREGIIHKTLIKNTAIDANGYEPCVIYINGNYYGMSEIREKIDEYYVEQNHGIDKDNVEVLADTNLVDIGNWQAFDSIYSYVLSHDLKVDEHFNVVESKIDLENMSDYFIAETYFDNNDWPSGNLRLWRQTQPGSKFRYIAFDLDASLGTFEWSPYTLNMLHEALNYFTTTVPNKHCIIFKKLLENSAFRKYFINRYADLSNTCFSQKYLLNMLDSVSLKVRPEIDRHFISWGKNFNDWENEINFKIKPYIQNRNQLSREDVLNEFNLPACHRIHLSTFPNDAFQNFSLNTITLYENNFSGFYYETVPIWFKAIAKKGYVFSHWQQNNGTKYFNDSISVSLTENSEFTAIYFPESDKKNFTLFPNPCEQQSIFIRFFEPLESLQNISIYNAFGELLNININPKLVGDFTLECETFNLKSGLYFIKIEMYNKSEVLKFIKV